MKQAIRKTLALAALGIAGLAATGMAHAGGVNWHIGINLPGVFYPQPAVVYSPPPVVYAPPPVVYAPPPPVYYQPAPVYYQPAPVAYQQPAPVAAYPRGYWRDGRWCDDERRGPRHGRYDGDRDDRRADRYRY